MSGFPENPVLPPQPGRTRVRVWGCAGEGGHRSSGRAGWMVNGGQRQEHHPDWQRLGNGALVPSGRARHRSASQRCTQWRVGPVWSKLLFFARENGIPEFYVNASIFVDGYWFPEAQ